MDDRGSAATEQPAGQPGRDGVTPSITILVASLREQIRRLALGERALFDAELRERRERLTTGSGMLAGTALLGFFGFAALVTCAVVALALPLPAWLAALLVAVALLILAAVFVLLGMRKLKGDDDAP
ncbi:MAG TPA: phage holin family protein [Glaciibacter sp.]|nr:phage holin family protein [Glaciibacter sp.]